MNPLNVTRRFKYGKDSSYYLLGYNIISFDLVGDPGFVWAPYIPMLRGDFIVERPLGPPSGRLFFIDFKITRKKFKYGK